MHDDTENIQIECEENCGNSPKKQLLRDINIAFAKNDFDFCMSWIRDDIIWEMIGDQRLEGKEALRQEWDRMKERKVQQLIIHNIITHGNAASVNGTVKLQDDQTIAFCDVYQFAGFGKNAKIKTITSYVVPLT